MGLPCLDRIFLLFQNTPIFLGLGRDKTKGQFGKITSFNSCKNIAYKIGPLPFGFQNQAKLQFFFFFTISNKKKNHKF